ncbi:Hsp20/alpha crystallin family protein [Rubrobacter taiwanensis]|uniref:Hsp20/alpha crystallin family protein n=1 Tax=Rubrobacter taiwanensis TaxID=185139 RepID=A0A4R1BS26_9ACTN|nr:Hsp20/alpha crystallin family protein [Rubrobacter taiwanensis]TCJ20451.1 Hsp20/alpha crystallin family protein [Rubrobacter taiwanensis]
MTLAPFRGFWDVQNEIDRMFDRMVRNLFGRRTDAETARTWTPLLDAYAREGDLVIHAYLPGVGLEDLDITLEGNMLTISGERKGLAGDGGYYLREAPFGPFRRSVAVPEGVEPESVKAALRNGVLEIVLPGAVAEGQPKKIAVEAAEGAPAIEG